MVSCYITILISFFYRSYLYVSCSIEGFSVRIFFYVKAIHGASQKVEKKKKKRFVLIISLATGVLFWKKNGIPSRLKRLCDVYFYLCLSLARYEIQPTLYKSHCAVSLLLGDKNKQTLKQLKVRCTVLRCKEILFTCYLLYKYLCSTIFSCNVNKHSYLLCRWWGYLFCCPFHTAYATYVTHIIELRIKFSCVPKEWAQVTPVICVP